MYIVNVDMPMHMECRAMVLRMVIHRGNGGEAIGSGGSVPYIKNQMLTNIHGLSVHCMWNPSETFRFSTIVFMVAFIIGFKIRFVLKKNVKKFGIVKKVFDISIVLYTLKPMGQRMLTK